MGFEQQPDGSRCKHKRKNSRAMPETPPTRPESSRRGSVKSPSPAWRKEKKNLHNRTNRWMSGSKIRAREGYAIESVRPSAGRICGRRSGIFLFLDKYFLSCRQSAEDKQRSYLMGQVIGNWRSRFFRTWDVDCSYCLSMKLIYLFELLLLLKNKQFSQITKQKPV